MQGLRPCNPSIRQILWCDSYSRRDVFKAMMTSKLVAYLTFNKFASALPMLASIRVQSSSCFVVRLISEHPRL